MIQERQRNKYLSLSKYLIRIFVISFSSIIIANRKHYVVLRQYLSKYSSIKINSTFVSSCHHIKKMIRHSISF